MAVKGKSAKHTEMASTLGKLGGRPRKESAKHGPNGSNANKHWNNETQNAYRGSVSKQLSPIRFNIKKGNSRGI